LGGIDWVDCFKRNISPMHQPFKNLDSIAFEHIKEFWKVYNINFNLKIEHKLNRTFLKCSYMNKAHYMMLIFDSID
jgi:hypothetical protein